MQIGPIWRAGLRNKTGIVLIVLQFAFTMALVVNAIAIAQERAADIREPSGMDEPNVFHVASAGFAQGLDAKLTMEEDLRRIRALPGVRAAVATNAVPLSGSGWGMGFKTVPGSEIEPAFGAVYMVDELGLEALGVELVAGAPFEARDVTWRLPATPERQDPGWPDKIILTQALAERLFPGDAGLGVGKVVYIDDAEPMTVTGIVSRLSGPWNGWNDGQSAIVPQHFANTRTSYLIRAEPGQLDSLMPQVETLLAQREPGRIVENLRSMVETRERNYQLDQALVNILVFTIGLLVAITTLGVGGLTSFNVTRRIKHIGTRRALGATRGAILRYFLTENLLVTLIGVTLGAVLAVAVNVALVGLFDIPRFDWYLVPGAMLALIAIGQLAVLIPARRAARVPPVVATRTV